MSDEQGHRRQVPGTPEDSGERLQSRPYGSDFAHLPDHEVHERPEPGGGPRGGVGGTSLPVVVIGVGVVVAFSTFFFRSLWALGIGLVIVLAGALWAGIGEDHPGAMGGTGPSEPDEHG